MDALQVQKSLLAKLLATENVDVIHDSSLVTAAFSPKERKLYLPVWKDMNNDVYDLFVCHEVSHALHTPAEGWHDAIHELGASFKSYLNVVEDCRIEKLIKKRYPGARAAMYRGYQYINDVLDMFGIQKNNVDVNELPLIDRINLFYKSSSSADIDFSAEEYEYIKLIDESETFDEVLEIAKSLYELASEEESRTDYTVDVDGYSIVESDYDSNESNDDFETEFNEGVDDNEEESGQDGDEIEHEEQGEGESSSNDSDQADDGGDEKQNDDEEQSSYGPRGGSYEDGELDYPTEPPKSLTDEVFRNKEILLVDKKSLPYVYLNMPEFLTENVIIDHKMYDDMCVDFRSRMSDENQKMENTIDQVIDTFNGILFRENKPFVSHMIKEFEMRKRASEYKRSSIAKTGVLDLSNIFKHKFSDELFKKIQIVKDGKNHGFVIFFDWSSSMSTQLYGCMQQLYLLLWFCRRVKIPFRIFTFVDYHLHTNGDTDLYSTNITSKSPLQTVEYPHSSNLAISESSIYGNHSFHLIEWFNSDMRHAKFQEQLRRFTRNVLRNVWWSYRSYNSLRSHIYDTVHNALELTLPDEFERREAHDYLSRSPSYPYSNLSGTPLNETILHAVNVVNDFRKMYKVEICTVIFITDGDSSGGIGQMVDIPQKDKKVFKTVNRGNNIVIVDPKTKQTYDVQATYGITATDVLLQYLRDKIDSPVVNFFLATSIHDASRHAFGQGSDGCISNEDWSSLRKQLSKQLKDDGYAISTKRGYTKSFVIKGADLQIDNNEELEIKSNSSIRAVARQLSKFNKQKVKKRVLLSAFIDEIA